MKIKIKNYLSSSCEGPELYSLESLDGKMAGLRYLILVVAAFDSIVNVRALYINS